MNTDKHKNLLAILALAALCLVAYSNSFQVPFQYDDNRLIRFNFSLRDLGQWKGIAQSEYFRSLTMLSFALNFQISQKDTFSYHVVNLGLHFLAATFFFLFLRRLSPHYLYCALAAALFAVHPLNTESVSYISSRSIVLCSVFYWLALLSFDSYVRTSRVYYAFAFFFFFVLGSLTKEEAALIPAAALLYNYCFFGWESVKRRRFLHFASLFIVGCGFLFRIAVELQHVDRLPYPIPVYFATEVNVWLRYLWLAIFPVFLNVDHYVRSINLIQMEFWISALIVGTMLFGLWEVRKKHMLITFWGAWFFLNLLPSSSLFPLQDFMAEHRAYLSLFGYCAVLAFLIVIFQTSMRSPRLIQFALVVFLCFYVFASYQRNRVWENSLTLWSDAVLKSPQKMRPHVNLAFAFFLRGAYDEAIEQYLEAGLIDPNLPLIYSGLGFCFLQKGDAPKAEDNFRIALGLDRGFTDAKTGIGILLYRRGEFSEALSYFESAYPKRKESAELIAMMAMCYLRTGQTQKAIALLREGAYVQSQLRDSLKLLESGRVQEAERLLVRVEKGLGAALKGGP